MKIRKSHIIIISFIVVLAFVLVVIQYYHFRGVKDSLERLVEQKTKGLYKLDLGETKYDFIKLDFILKDARIYRIDTINKKRIYSVELLYVEIDLGSMESYFDFKQINVKEFIISEPVIVLQKENSKKQRLSLSAELVKVLRMVKEILDSFNVHSFKIIKGSFILNKGDKTLRVGLIDFLAKEWNVRKLSDKSDVEINLGRQSIDIFHHNFSFEQIEYSYLKRQLKISDFKYHHTDTITGARLDAKGGAFIVDHIDWNELYSTERYKLKKIELVNADIRGSFPLSVRKKTDGDFFKVIRDAVDELMIDSLLVRHANVHLAYKQKEDSTSVSFQNASFTVSDFKLLDTDEVFEIGQLRFNLNQTLVTLGKDYRVRFDSLFYNRYKHQQLSVLGVEVIDRHAKQPFFVSKQVLLMSFNPFDFLLNKRLKADALELNNVELSVLPERLKIKSNSEEKKPIKIDLKKFNLNHVRIQYGDEDKKVVINDLNLSVKNVHTGSRSNPSFDFVLLKLARLNYFDLNKKNSINVEAVSLDKKELTAQLLTINQPEKMLLDFNDVVLTYDSLRAEVPDHLNSFHAGKLRIKSAQSVPDKKKPSFPNITINQFSIDSVIADVQSGSNIIGVNAANFLISDIQMDSSFFKWGLIKTDILKFSFINPSWSAEGRNSTINSNSVSLLNELKLMKKDSSFTLTSSSLAIKPFRDFKFISGVNLIKPDIYIHQDNFYSRSTIDSISIHGLNFTGKPEVKEIQIYRPVAEIHLPENNGERKAKSRNGLDFPKEIGELKIYKANVIVKRKGAPVFIYNMNAQWKHQADILLSIDSLTALSTNLKIAFHQVQFSPNQLHLGKLDIVPLEDTKSYSLNGIERDWLKLNFSAIKITGFSLDSVLYGNKLGVNEVDVGAFQIDVLRDKHLPDPPYEEKEMFSRTLYCQDKPVEINLVRFASGSVYVQQISDRTNETGRVEINDIKGEIENVMNPIRGESKFHLDASAQMYGQGLVGINYTIDGLDRFKMEINANDFDLNAFNKILQPLESVRFKSGRLKRLQINAEANNLNVSGTTSLHYEGLRIKIMKADRTAFHNEMTSVLANELIKNKKEVTASLIEERDRSSSEFSYWVKIALKGALGAARHGKKQKISK